MKKNVPDVGKNRQEDPALVVSRKRSTTKLSIVIAAMNAEITVRVIFNYFIYFKMPKKRNPERKPEPPKDNEKNPYGTPAQQAAFLMIQSKMRERLEKINDK